MFCTISFYISGRVFEHSCYTTCFMSWIIRKLTKLIATFECSLQSKDSRAWNFMCEVPPVLRNELFVFCHVNAFYDSIVSHWMSLVIKEYLVWRIRLFKQIFHGAAASTCFQGAE